MSTTARTALGAAGAALGGLAIHDLLQRKHAILRNYPVVGHARFLLEDIRPELQQYFIERNWDGRPYDRDIRSIVYVRAMGVEHRRPHAAECRHHPDEVSVPPQPTLSQGWGFAIAKVKESFESA